MSSIFHNELINFSNAKPRTIPEAREKSITDL